MTIGNESMAKARTVARKRAQTMPFGILAGLLIGIALILLSVFLFTTQTARTDSKTAALGVQLENLNGGAMKLSDLRGKYVMVNLWATWRHIITHDAWRVACA